MNNTALLALTTILACAPSQAALFTNLVAYYDFDSAGAAGLANQAPGATGFDATGPTWNVADATGPGFTGNATYNPGDGLSDRSGLLVGNALNLADLNGEFITVPLGMGDLGNSFSISAWTYLAPGASNASPRFHAFEASNNYDVSWGTNSVPGGPDEMLGYGGQTIYGTNGLLVEEVWQHTLHVFDSDGTNTTLSIYLDGTLLGTPLNVTTASINFSALRFGDARAGASGDRDWDGMFDEIAIWDRALTGGEAFEAYTLGNTGTALVPEPSSAALLGLGGLALILRRRKTA